LTDLSRLKVSLTKFGAHKLATLLEQFDSSQVLNHLWGSVPGANVEDVQARKNLSVGKDGKVPVFWDDARAAGAPTLEALVLIAIISSHVSLIDALKRGARGPEGTGVIEKGAVLRGKEFTNFKHTLEELGYATRSSPEEVSYDFSKLFVLPGLNVLAAKLLTLKLRTAGWDEKNSLEDELIRLGIQNAFSADASAFRDWLTTGAATPPIGLPTPDVQFFQGRDEKLLSTPFKFKAGHTRKKTGKVKITAPTTDAEAELLHNAMQTQLYDDLVLQHGAACVGTEIKSGNATAIDLVVETAAFRWFYEIKTASSVKACIRQAIPQLLEYAYWQCDISRAQKLIIVGPKAVTKEGAAYLDFLRKSFQLELYYEQCKVKTT
jgi:hypothetical protein